MIKGLMRIASEEDERLILYNGEALEHRGIKILPFAEYLSGTK